LLPDPDMAAAEEITVKQIRIQRLRARREHPGREVLPRDARDPDVVRVKALARSRLTGSSRSNRTQEVNTMHPSMIGLLARQCESELRRSALRHVLTCPAAAARSGTAPDGRWWRSASRSPTGQAMPDTQPGATGAITRCACWAPAMGGWPRR
jgi:hypothetical protein